MFSDKASHVAPEAVQSPKPEQKKKRRKYKSVRFYQVKRLRRSRKRRLKREAEAAKLEAERRYSSPETSMFAERPRVQAPVGMSMPPLEMGDKHHEMQLQPARPAPVTSFQLLATQPVQPAQIVRGQPVPIARAQALQNLARRFTYPGDRAPPLVKSETGTESYEIKLESRATGIKLENRIQPTRYNGPYGSPPGIGRKIPPQNTSDVLQSLMPVRSARGMVESYVDHLSNRGRVIAPMGTMPNYNAVYHSISRQQNPRTMSNLVFPHRPPSHGAQPQIQLPLQPVKMEHPSVPGNTQPNWGDVSIKKEFTD